MQTKGMANPAGKVASGTIGNTGVMVGAVINGHLNALIDTHLALLHPKKQQATPEVRKTAEGEIVCRVQPAPSAAKAKNGSETWPKLDMYIQPGKEASRGEAYARAHAAPRDGACVVLGAGNQPMLGMSDTLNKMFLENFPVVLKHHDAQVQPLIAVALKSADALMS